MALTDPFILSVFFVFAAEMGDKLIKYGAAGIFLITGTITLIEAGANRWLP